MAAVSKVDAAMCKIRDAGKIKARDRIAVLAALNLAFEDHTPAAGAAPPQPSPSEGPAESLSGGDAQRLSQLLQRLDQALGRDGQLI